MKQINSAQDTILDRIKNSLWLFFLPAILLYVIFFLAPIPTSFYYSFFRWRAVGVREFIGLGNWIRFLNDGVFWRAFYHNILLVIGSLAIQIPVSIGLALIIHSKIKGVNLFKYAYFVPFIFSAVAVGLVWRYILQPHGGLLNEFLELIGLGNLTQLWLADSSIALYTLIVVIGWRFIPLYMIIFLSALKGIPHSIYEASQIDGANKWQQFFHITLPSLKPTIRMAGMLIIVGSLKFFPLIWVLTGGGPGHSTEVMATYMYKNAFVGYSLGYGSTIATAMFIVVALAVFIFLYFTNAGKEEVV